MLDAPPGAGPLQPLLRDVAMSAFDLARADWQPVGQSLAVVQVVGASAEIAVAGSHGRVLVIDLGGLAMSGERLQDEVETPAFKRVLLGLHPGAPRRRASDARPLRPRPRSSPHKPASGSLARAPATASLPARTTSCPCACLSPRNSARRSEPCRRPSRRRSAF